MIKNVITKKNMISDKICNILEEELKREDITKEERKDIYNLLGEVNSSTTEIETRKNKHVTSRIITGMGIGASVIISLGSCLIHKRYKINKEK
ncbi:hypothetical protein ACFIJ5_14395 [Haloimpatiens sp. FM7330]|uniref:hypothetical protein n=1 Tax=Haloimpatiens sp. FM7330 TaxID=3298610 RepID=UPI00363ADA3A